jgi:hypothetical protein
MASLIELQQISPITGKKKATKLVALVILALAGELSRLVCE